MQFNNVLDKVFAYPIGIKVLRFLILYKPEMTGREIAKFCKISHMHVYRILNAFESQGIVTKVQVGRSVLFKLNERNIIVKEFLQHIFKKEKTLLDDTVRHAVKKIQDKTDTIVIFGSAAKETEKPDSDVDIFILAKNEAKKRLIEDALPDIEIEFYALTGNRFAPVVLTSSEFKNKFSTKMLLFSKIDAGKLIFGKPLKEILHCWKIAKKTER